MEDYLEKVEQVMNSLRLQMLDENMQNLDEDQVKKVIHNYYSHLHQNTFQTIGVTYGAL